MSKLPPPPRTGWAPGMLQDDCRDLSRWLASRIDSRRHAREAAQAIVALLLLATQAAAQPAWIASPDYTMDVSWTRSASSPPFVHGGVCHLFFADDSERSMSVADAQIERCMVQSKHQKLPVTSTTPPAGTKRIQVYVMDNFAQIATMRADVLPGNPGVIAGFYRQMEDACLIVVKRASAAVGHELKHCFDGAWHASPAGVGHSTAGRFKLPN